MKILINSIPKSGTHLLANFVSLVTTGEPCDGAGRFIREASEAPFSYETVLTALETRMMKGGGIWTAHVLYQKNLELDLARMGVTTFFLYRDPRAIAVSRAHYLGKHQGHYHSEHLARYRTVSARICEVLRGWGDRQNMDASSAMNIDIMCRSYMPWRDVGPSLRYEDLLENGAREVEYIASALSMTVDNPARIAEEALAVQTATFRQGTVDGWREDWTAQHEAIFRRVAPKLLEDMGYAAD